MFVLDRPVETNQRIEPEGGICPEDIVEVGIEPSGPLRLVIETALNDDFVLKFPAKAKTFSCLNAEVAVENAKPKPPAAGFSQGIHGSQKARRNEEEK